jgi:hypothetical protein
MAAIFRGTRERGVTVASRHKLHPLASTCGFFPEANVWIAHLLEYARSLGYPLNKLICSRHTGRRTP